MSANFVAEIEKLQSLIQEDRAECENLRVDLQRKARLNEELRERIEDLKKENDALHFMITQNHQRISEEVDLNLLDNQVVNFAFCRLKRRLSSRRQEKSTHPWWKE